MRFSVSYDGLTKGISAAVVVLLVAIAAYTQSLIPAAIGALVMLGGYAFSPRGYTCAGCEIVVHRLIGDVHEPLGDIRELRLATSDDLRGSLRIVGSGGFFGYYGLFRTSGLGMCTWYATRRDRMVVVITSTRTTLYSPDRPGPFLDAVRAMAPVPEPSAGAPPSTAPRRSRALVWILGGVGVLVVGLIGAALYYNPGPARYSFQGDALTIHDPCFYSVTVRKSEIDFSGIRIVDFANEREWRPTARTNGFANAHYASGWFRAANGRKMRMYRAGGNILILLPPAGNGTPILYQPPDPATFLSELRRAW